MSEGEKKLILVKTVLEILSDEKTLVLMDEPDAHLHEGRKPALCNMMREYPNRQIVIATHSPIMAQIANEKELLMLELENGKSTILTDEKIEKIKKLSGTSWDVIGQGMMLRSSRPLVVFEGKTDVMYVKRALEMLKSRVTDYAFSLYKNQFSNHRSRYTYSDTIHLLHPLHLVGGFELFRDTFLFGVFFYQPRKEGLCFFLYIGEVGM